MMEALLLSYFTIQIDPILAMTFESRYLVELLFFVLHTKMGDKFYLAGFVGGQTLPR